MILSVIKNKVVNNKVAKNAGWIIAGRVANMICSFVVSLLVARYLGPSNFGLINYATAYTTFFASLCTLGINSVIVKEFVDYPDKEGESIGTSLLLRAISSLLSIFLIIVVSSILDHGERITILVVALCSFGLFFQIFDTFNYWYQAHLISKYSAIASSVAYVVMSAYKIYLLVTGKSVIWFAIATSVDYIVIAIILVYFYKKNNGPKLRVSRTRAKSILSKSCHFILAGLMVSIYGATDRLMLKHMLDESAVGYYSLAVSLCNIWVFVLSAIIDSLTPVILENAKSNKEKYVKLNKQLYSIVFYVSFFVSICFIIFGKIAIRILYGEAYLPATGPLYVITWYVAFSYLGVARNPWIVTENMEKYLVFIYLGAAVSNVILNAALIPSFGTIGAAIASLVTQISTIVVFPLFIKGMRPNVKLMVDAILLRDIR